MDYGSYDRNLIRNTDVLLLFGILVYYLAIYRLPLTQKDKFWWAVGMIPVIIIYLFLKYRFKKMAKSCKVMPVSQAVSSLALIGEDHRILREWNIYGKIGLLIGKNTNENEVDIDLSFTSDAPFISKQHAILNYFDGHWYVEDAGSKNGIEIKKASQENVYKLTESKPVRLDRGDIIKINETALLLR